MYLNTFRKNPGGEVVGKGRIRGDPDWELHGNWGNPDAAMREKMLREIIHSGYDFGQ